MTDPADRLPPYPRSRLQHYYATLPASWKLGDVEPFGDDQWHVTFVDAHGKLCADILLPTEPPKYMY